jgi:cell division protein FtsQ
MSRAQALANANASTLASIRPTPIQVWGLLIVLLLAGLWVLVPDDAPLTQLELRGPFEHLQPRDVQEAAAPFLRSDFFALDVAALRRAVSALPWVAEARVERRWPGVVEVRVVERQPYARWNQDGLLDTDANAFVPPAAEIPAGLPQLGGTAGHEIEVAHAWKRLSRVLADTPLALRGLQLDQRGQWQAQTHNDIEVRFGANPPDDRLPMLRDVVLKTLGDRWEQVAYVDLRYTNGFAVGWRKTETTGAER